jgi:hypothetical protein
MSKPIEGGCQCGHVRYRIDGPFVHASYCHCRICQRTTASPAGVYAAVAPSHFRYTANLPKVFHSSQKAQREFCGECGYHILFRRKDKESLAVTVASLDNPAQIEPTLHIWTESRIPWFETRDAHERRKQARA